MTPRRTQLPANTYDIIRKSSCRSSACDLRSLRGRCGILGVRCSRWRIAVRCNKEKWIKRDCNDIHLHGRRSCRVEIGSGSVRGTIKKKHISEITFKGYTVRASKDEPQYEIQSDTTDHVAMHKGQALKRSQKANPDRVLSIAWSSEQ